MGTNSAVGHSRRDSSLFPLAQPQQVSRQPFTLQLVHHMMLTGLTCSSQRPWYRASLIDSGNCVTRLRHA